MFEETGLASIRWVFQEVILPRHDESGRIFQVHSLEVHVVFIVWCDSSPEVYEGNISCT